jgi:hypothetical protein
MPANPLLGGLATSMRGKPSLNISPTPVDRMLILGPDAVVNRTKVMGSVPVLGHLRSMA